MEEHEGWVIRPPEEAPPSSEGEGAQGGPAPRRRRVWVWAVVAGGVFLLLGLLFGGVALAFYFAMREGRVFGPAVGLVEVTGPITLDGGASLFGHFSGAKSITKQLRRAMEEERIKAVVLRINSPGGTAAASQEIYRAVMRLRRKKPVVAYLGDMATSGAYYVASAAEVIVASPGSVTGSIGVIVELVDLSGLMEKLGIRAVTIKSGEFKDIGSFLRPPTPKERALLKSLVMDIYEQFVRDVARGRGLPIERVREIADGRILTGRMAKSYGLVDVLGSYEDAVRIAARKAGIKERPRVVRLGPRRVGLLEVLIGGGEWGGPMGWLFSYLSTPVKLLPPCFAR